MGKYNIGFIAGCVNLPLNNIDEQDLYHQIILTELRAYNQALIWEAHLGSFSSYSQLPDKMEKFIDQNDTHLLCLFVRFFPFMPLFKPLIKYESKEKKKRFALHPALFAAKSDWNSEYSRFLTEQGYTFRKRKRWAGRDFNLLAGKFLGLHSWANQYIGKQVLSVSEICKKKNVQLLLISPPQNPESIMGDYVCKNVSASLFTYCQEKAIPFVDIYSLDKQNFSADYTHYNTKGHIQLAEKLLPAIRQLISL